jgi:hypothetical protein
MDCNLCNNEYEFPDAPTLFVLEGIVRFLVDPS